MSNSGIFILGSTGGTGELLTRNLAGDRAVTVMHRTDKRREDFEAMGATVIMGDAMDRASMFAATQTAAGSCDTVVSLLGGIPFTDPDGWPDYTGNVNAIDAALEVGIQRFILVTSIGTGSSSGWVPEESFLIPLLELKTRAEQYLQNSSLDWTIVKPGGLGKPGEFPDAPDEVLVTENPAVRGVIERGPLADVITQVIRDSDGRTFGRQLHVAAHKLQCFDGEPEPFSLS